MATENHRSRRKASNLPQRNNLVHYNVITTAIVYFVAKMKLAISALLIGSAVAFAPTQTSKVRFFYTLEHDWYDLC